MVSSAAAVAESSADLDWSGGRSWALRRVSRGRKEVLGLGDGSGVDELHDVADFVLLVRSRSGTSS